MIALDALDFLTGEAGQRALHWLAEQDLADAHTLALLTTLRRTLTPEQAGAALELARLRRRAVDKFGSSAAVMYFTREALEQASDPHIRRYRAQTAQVEQVVDACCGIAADALAFAETGAHVLGIDLDPVRVAMARLNAAALGLAARFEVGDVTAGLPPAPLVFFDPARRDARGERIHHVEGYQPPLSTVRRWGARRCGVKLSPGVDLAQLDGYGGTVEFISVDGDLKEAYLIWEGEAGTPRLEAVAIQGGRVERWVPAASAIDVPVAEPRRWLVEPDPALIRAHLVTQAAAHFDGALLDETIAYFTTDTHPQSSWVRAWRVRDWLPFNVKRLRAYLRSAGIGQVTVKKRGTAVTPDSLIPQLKARGEGSATLVLTRCRGRQIVLICDDLQAGLACGDDAQ